MPRTLLALAVMAIAFGCGGDDDHDLVLDPIGPKTVQELQTLKFEVHASDGSTGSLLSLWVTNLPSGAQFETGLPCVKCTEATHRGTFTWTPGAGTAGKYSLTFKVANYDRTAQEQVEITVTPSGPVP